LICERLESPERSPRHASVVRITYHGPISAGSVSRSVGSTVSCTRRIGVLESKGTALPLAIRQPQGCGCQAQGGAAPALVLVVLGLVVRRRRR